MKRISMAIGITVSTFAQAGDVPDLPDVLTLNRGTPVQSATMWQQERRPEILELFRTHVYGRTPEMPGKVTFDVFEEDGQALEGTAIRRQIAIETTSRGKTLRINLLTYLPASAKQVPVPVLVLLNFGGNHTIHRDPAIVLAGGNQTGADTSTEARRGASSSQYPVEQILARGYGIATAWYHDIDPDIDDGFQNGVHPLLDPPEGRKPDAWGAVGAWAWGLSRAMDYFETDAEIDHTRVAVLGHSRLGKTALWAGAQDTRFAMVISNDSGCTGAALARRREGETVKAINDRFPHWFCENYRRFNDREHDLPVDQHMLIALVAPRPVYVASATRDAWADPAGEFLSCVHAEPVYRLFGFSGLETDTMPEPDQPIADTHIGYHVRTGKHDLTSYDWHRYLDFADRHWGRPASVPTGDGNLPAGAGPATPLARPTQAQYAYHEQERIMFVCLDPCTWQGREYDNHTTDLKDMTLPKLDVDQWCEAALAWGAREILLVAKHTGGFCWWQTATTEYSVKNIAWKDGQGDLVDEVAQACRRHGLNLGIYIYPGDDQWGAAIGSGGRTSDPARQEEYNQVLRTQWTEILSRHRENLVELWFDGSCYVPLGDVFERYVGDEVVYLQGPHANLRWVGTESGIAPYPGWNTLARTDLDTGVSTAVHGDPDGDAWAPLECDTTLYDHNWFWSEQNEKKRKSLAHLVRLFYRSVGRGATLLLNSTPNTAGLIPAGDMACYQALGHELDRRFRDPLGEAGGRGPVHTIRLHQPTLINQFMIMEAYRYGHRIRGFVVEARTPDGRWIELNRGSAVGRKRIVMFEPVEVTQVTLRVTDHVEAPLIRDFKVYYVEGDNEGLYETTTREAVSRNARASASDEHSAPYIAGKICDGNSGTWWGVSEKVKPPYACWVELDLGHPQCISQTVIDEPWNRTEAFQLEYRDRPDQEWKVALADARMGADYTRTFAPATGRYWRLHTLKANHYPAIKEWELFSVPSPEDLWQTCGRVDPDGYSGDTAQVDLDLSPHIRQPGQYLLRLDDVGRTGTAVQNIEVLYDGRAVHEHVLSPVKSGEMYLLNRQAQVVEDSRITLKVTLRCENPQQAGTELAIKPAL